MYVMCIQCGSGGEGRYWPALLSATVSFLILLRVAKVRHAYFLYIGALSVDQNITEEHKSNCFYLKDGL